MPERYIKKILNARVYDVAIEAPVKQTLNLTRRFGNNVLSGPVMAA